MERAEAGVPDPVAEIERMLAEREPDLVVVWCRTSGSAAWQPIIADENEAEAIRSQLTGGGGIEARVAHYRQIKER